jgi:hypothetical protein
MLAMWVLEKRVGTGDSIVSGTDDSAVKDLQNVEILAKRYSLPKLTSALLNAAMEDLLKRFRDFYEYPKKTF